MKKEYIILVALIICLSAYLMFRSDNRDNYKLPVIEKIEPKDITSILIEKKDGPVKLNHADNKWTVTDNHYTIDISMVDVILDTLKTFRLSALISQQKDLKRYKLDDENRIQVTVVENSAKTFKFSIGKEAPTGNHTFVMLEGDSNIYHANGSFTFDFDQDVEAFRDKMYFQVKADAVKRLSVNKGKTGLTVVATEEKDKDDKVTQSWQSEDGKSQEKEKILNFLNSISYLRCDSYRNDKTKKDTDNFEAVCTIKIDDQEKKSLKLFKFYDSTQLFGVSSMNNYVFKLSDFDSKEILSNVDTFLGIKSEDK